MGFRGSVTMELPDEKKLFKLRKVMPTNMPEELDSMDEEALKKRIVDCGYNVREAKEELSKNERLQALKEEIKEIRGPFRDVIKCQEAIRDYALYVLERRGKL